MAAEKGGTKRESDLIKSKERVKKHGEVFTPAWVVRDMCDMLAENSAGEDVFRIESTFLEPACGTGNFLTEIFARKLTRCRTVQDGLAALSSIYGIDILPDNVEESRANLKEMFHERFGAAEEIDSILDRNILCGDFLTGLTSNGQKIWFLEDNKDYWDFIEERQKKTTHRKR